MGNHHAMDAKALPTQHRYDVAVQSCDAIVIGSGPNGLAAAITLAQAGKKVIVFEANEQPGGGVRSMSLTEPGFLHDLCSAVHPMALASPFFQSLHLERFGLKWIYSPIALVHPLDDGTCAVAMQDLDRTCEELQQDGTAYRAMFGPLLAHADALFEEALGPLHAPRHPLLAFHLARRALQSADALTGSFRSPTARAMLGGMAAHATLPFSNRFSAAVPVMLGLALHTHGWPFPKGGAQALTTALVECLESLGGELLCNRRIESLAQLPASSVVLFDTSPGALATIAEHHLPASYKQKLRHMRYGPSIYKVDWALDGAIPWMNKNCALSATVHLGNTYEEIRAWEAAVWTKEAHGRPFVILTQPSLFDPTRAPSGKHTAWAYCHVPHGSTQDMTESIEQQVERFAPGFRKTIIRRSVLTPQDIERHNANNVSGDITGGIMDVWQWFARPVMRANPYATPNSRLSLCSSSTPPGPGVHGMCGYHAAVRALRTMPC